MNKNLKELLDKRFLENNIASKISVTVIAIMVGFAAGFLNQNTNVYAATNKTLEQGKEYYFDLNGDGKNEKIKYVTKVKDSDSDFFDSVSLFINDKNVYTKKLTDTWAKYTVLDIDSSDKALDLNLQIGGYSDCMDYSSFQRWNGTTITEYDTNKNKALNYTREYSFSNVKGNGRFNIVVDTPYSLPIGCFYANIPLKLQNNKITTTTGTYNLVGISKKYKYKARNSIKVYKKASKKSKVKFKIKKGEKIKIIKIKPTKNVAKRPQGKYGEEKPINAYAYVKTKSGKKGWIYLSKNKSSWGKNMMFKQVPGWG